MRQLIILPTNKKTLFRKEGFVSTLELQDETMVDSIDVNQTQLAAALDKEQMQRAYRALGQNIRHQPLGDERVEVFVEGRRMHGYLVPPATRFDEDGRALEAVLFCFDSPHRDGQVAPDHVIKIVSVPKGRGFDLVALEYVYMPSYGD